MGDQTVTLADPQITVAGVNLPEFTAQALLRAILDGDNGFLYIDPSEDDVRGLASTAEQRTQRGAVGYPELASPEKGKRFLQAAIDRTVEVIEALLKVADTASAKDRTSFLDAHAVETTVGAVGDSLVRR